MNTLLNTWDTVESLKRRALNWHTTPAGKSKGRILISDGPEYENKQPRHQSRPSYPLSRPWLAQMRLFPFEILSVWQRCSRRRGQWMISNLLWPSPPWSFVCKTTESNPKWSPQLPTASSPHFLLESLRVPGHMKRTLLVPQSEGGDGKKGMWHPNQSTSIVQCPMAGSSHCCQHSNSMPSIHCWVRGGGGLKIPAPFQPSLLKCGHTFGTQ